MGCKGLVQIQVRVNEPAYRNKFQSSNKNNPDIKVETRLRRVEELLLRNNPFSNKFEFVFYYTRLTSPPTSYDEKNSCLPSPKRRETEYLIKLGKQLYLASILFRSKVNRNYNSIHIGFVQSSVVQY